VDLFSNIDSLGTGLLQETVNEVMYRKIPSPDSSGKPMLVENYFLWWWQSDQRKLLTAARKRV